MAAGPVVLQIKDVLGNLISALFWSSDGATTGQLSPIHHLDDAQLAALIGEAQANPTANTVLDRLKALLTDITLAEGAHVIGKVGIDPALNGVVASPAPAQDPILDHANGVKATVTASETVFTPPADCFFAEFLCDLTCFVRTDDQIAADDAQSIKLLADQPRPLPVTPGVGVRAFAASAAVLRIVPYKARP